MIFIDEETRDDFHKAETLVQIVCQMLENEALNYDAQVRVIGIEGGAALVQLTSGEPDIVIPLCNNINQRFKRTDNVPVCMAKDLRMRHILIRLTHPSQLCQLI